MSNSSSLSERVGSGVVTVDLLRTLPIWNGQAAQVVCSDIGYLPLDHLWGDIDDHTLCRPDGRKSGYIRLADNHPIIEDPDSFDVISHLEVVRVKLVGRRMIDAVKVWCESVSDNDPPYIVPSFPLLDCLLSADSLPDSIIALTGEGFSRFILAGGYFYDMEGNPCIACFHSGHPTLMYIQLQNARFQEGDCFIAIAQNC